MKKILLSLMILLFTINANSGCRNSLPLSEAIKAVNLEPGAGSKSCKNLPLEKCVCYDGKVWQHSKIVDEKIKDEKSPIWGTRSMVTPCDGESECKSKSELMECLNGRHSLYNAEYSEMWCNKITGYNKKFSGKKILVVDEVKKSIHDSAMADLKTERDQDRDKRSDLKKLLISLKAGTDLTPAQMRKLQIQIIKKLFR